MKPVAIKMLTLRNLSDESQSSFYAEVDIMSKLHMAEIVQLYGACVEPNRLCMVMELVKCGSLWDVLHKNDTYPSASVLTGDVRWKMALDAAIGINCFNTIHRYSIAILRVSIS